MGMEGGDHQMIINMAHLLIIHMGDLLVDHTMAQDMIIGIHQILMIMDLGQEEVAFQEVHLEINHFTMDHMVLHMVHLMVHLMVLLMVLLMAHHMVPHMVTLMVHQTVPHMVHLTDIMAILEVQTMVRGGTGQEDRIMEITGMGTEVETFRAISVVEEEVVDLNKTAKRIPAEETKIFP